MQSETDGNVHKIRFGSINELAELAESVPEHREDLHEPKFTGVRTHDKAFRLAREGWAEKLDETLSVAESAVEKVDRDLELPTFVAEHDVAGCEVDVARFLDGTPENMIDYPLRPIVRAGRVITLCVSLSASAAVDKSSLIRRGQTVAALALALSRLGYSLEVWADFSAKPGIFGSGTDEIVSVRTLIKGATDALDPERLAYALAHPSMLRVLNFAAARTAPKRFTDAVGYSSLGMPCDPVQDLPEGTLYTTSITSDRDVPDADKQLVEWLRELGIIED